MLNEVRPHLISIQGGTDMTYTNPETISYKETLSSWSETSSTAWFLPALSPALTWNDASVGGFTLGNSYHVKNLNQVCLPGHTVLIH